MHITVAESRRMCLSTDFADFLMRLAAAPASVRVIPDLHGEPDALHQALADLDSGPGSAAPHLVFLGDLVDNGPDSPAVLRRVLALVESGRATLLRSNHDDKLFRVLIGRKVRIGPHLQKTLADLRAQPDAAQLTRRFLDAYQQAPHWLVWQPPDCAITYLFAHGAVHPSMLLEPALLSGREREKLCWLALFGEGREASEPADLPVRTYSWIDKLADGMVAVVGHDIRSRHAPLQVTGVNGGKAVFLDTGCGKHRVHGGQLSWMDLPDGRFGAARMAASASANATPAKP